MRILKTTQTYYPYLHKGGPPAKVKGIARALARRGHDVTVLTADLGPTIDEFDDPDWRRERIKSASGWEWQDEGVKAIYLPTLMNYRATTLSPKVLRFCLLRLKDFDLVHVYGLYDVIGSVVAKFCRRRGIPYIIEPLGMFRPKVRSLQKKRVYHALVGDSLFRNAAAVIATSDTERKELMDGGIPAEKIVLRRNGLDLDEFKSMPARGAFRARLGVKEKQPLILFLGRVSFIKGLDLLVEAFSGVNSEARLVIAGPDDKDGCREKVSALVEELGLSRRVIQSAPLYGTEKLQAFVDADLFVLSSRYESFGNAAAEAIACGTPVLVTDDCGIAPLVNERAGLAVACSVEGLRDGLQRLLGDESLLSQLAGGCEHLTRELSWDRPVKEMERIYALAAKSKEQRAKGQEQTGKGKELPEKS
jgi:glycosyltransferase involved in cell wall biosynthesis